MKICVYAIAQNEGKHVGRFCDAAGDADYIAVLDTGSTDDTVLRLRERGCIVEQEIVSPWRFDTARNRSMELIPEDADVCLCLDLDEVLLPGWREELEKHWTPETEIGRYLCIAGRNADGSPKTTFMRDKLHARGCVRWIYPVHEVIEYVGQGVPERTAIPTMRCEHLPDETKSRAGYLPLLELAAQERPQDARCAHYLGREYMYHARYGDAIRELMRHLSLNSATWADERAASMRYLSECCRLTGDKSGSLAWAFRAISEQPALRECWYQAEKACYYAEDWPGICYFGERAAAIETRSEGGINESEAWGPAVHDLLSLGYWHAGYPELALKQGETALKLDPDNERIRKNIEYYRKGCAL